MVEKRTQRRLAAILAADVVGYSRLMEEDEAGTLAALKTRRQDILVPVVAEHSGRIIKVMGDGVLVEFASAVDAVQCAVELQRGFIGANEGVAETSRIVLRIGINLGDVIVEGSDLYGDGVNIAARLEALAEPGGICVSSQVHDAVRGKVKSGFIDMGENQLKNIAAPVRCFVLTAAERIETNSGTPAMPSIAVLPFLNLGGDPDQAYFADGLTEDIITELARFSSLTVIARNSSFQWRNRPDDAKKIGKSLGAQYLVEGSVRKLESRIRITAQLIEVATGRHLWAERYDRQIEQLFDVQDEVVRAIVTCTEHRIVDTSAEKVARRPPKSWAAHDYFLRGRKYLAHYDTYAEAEGPLRQAIELDPSMAEAHAGLVHAMVGKYFQNPDPQLIDEAQAHAQIALAINPNLSESHAAMSLVYAFTNDIEHAITSAKRALAINPNDVMAAADYAQWLVYAGKCEEALTELEGILRRDPIPPSWFWDTKGTALFQLKRYREAIDAYFMVNRRQAWQQAYIAAAHAYLGELGEAHRLIGLVLEIKPDMTISKMLKIDPFQTEEARQNLAEGLRKAGLPE